MKSILLIGLFSVSAYANNVNYQGSASYKRQGNVVSGSFSQLEQMGVERAAQEDAVSKCQATGASDCVIVSTSPAKHWFKLTCPSCTTYMYFCESSAVARGQR